LGRYLRRLIFVLAIGPLCACTQRVVTTPQLPANHLLVVDPTTALHHRLELLDHLSVAMDPAKNLQQGHYQLFIMDSYCPACRDALTTCVTQSSPAADLLVLDLAQDEIDDPSLLDGLNTLRVDKPFTVSSPTPLLLDINEGIVIGIKEDF
jgi:hypothetical protein